ncbi:hypothetical protein GC089_00945 [Cellulomonas sp. JZ18]|uniref:hypothetical protein n=1 Tax=Cellulomonas sp. JZ18 TaxID=2654191 RepID=UPI0012D45822|nr:hypothetical protein [Cellulomonas sp. JZ18]QGQ18095.1 hypothetical protein GC089_00945 [Cellulomonas sp. JZ18]
MGTVREYGFREYSDDLTPGNDGRSNLLFRDGQLSGHAEFQSVSTVTSDGGDVSDSDDEHDTDTVGTIGKIVVGVGVGALAAYGAVELGRRIVGAIRARRGDAGHPSAADAPAETAHASAEAEDAPLPDEVSQPDEADALVQEVQTLCDEATSGMKAYQARMRPQADVEQDEEPVRSETRGERRRER